MRNFSWGQAAAAALGIAFSAVAPQAASAATYVITSAQLDSSLGYMVGEVHAAGLAGGSEWGGIGQLKLTGTSTTGAAVSFESFCADIYGPLGPGIFSDASTSALPYTSAKMSALNVFLANATSLVVSTETSAAAQMGVWEILNEDSANGFSVGSGAFKITGDGLDSAITLANSWLSNVSDNSWSAGTSTLGVLDPTGTNQAQVYTIAGAPAGGSAPDISAVPEPGTWALTLIGFGALGASLRRRRPADAFA